MHVFSYSLEIAIIIVGVKSPGINSASEIVSYVRIAIHAHVVDFKERHLEPLTSIKIS